MDIGLITFPLIAGIITNLVTALINRSGWSSKAKTYVAFGVALLLTIAGVIFQIFPQAWPMVAAGIAAVFGVSQAVYPIIKPILKQLEEATTGKTATVDELDAIISEAINTEDVDDTPGKHALAAGEGNTEAVEV